MRISDWSSDVCSSDLLEEGPRFPHYPRLAGQQAWYLALQLRLLKAGERGGTPFAPIMHAVAERMSDAPIDDLAEFYAGLPARYAPPRLSKSFRTHFQPRRNRPTRTSER